MKRTPALNALFGHWRIVWMEQWDQDYVDLLESGFIKMCHDGHATFQFGTVTGYFHVNPKRAHFYCSWSGSQECEIACGEIYGTLEEEGKDGDLCGTIAFENGDESEYRAIRLI